MIIKSQLSEKDFIKANFAMNYQSIFSKIIYGMFAFIIVMQIVFIFVMQNSNPGRIAFPVIFLTAIFGLPYIAAIRNYRSNAMIRELIEYQFNDNELVVKGESFSS